MLEHHLQQGALRFELKGEFGESGDVRVAAEALSAVAVLEHADVKVNLLDTPGSPDLVGELRAGLRAADAVLFVVSEAGGMDAVTAQLWAEC
ncbi:MAG: hypothetical protein KY439_00175 [Actinobacteria bacterium]|nr:hypothetical protein [Actinomycetota bacterium]